MNNGRFQLGFDSRRRTRPKIISDGVVTLRCNNCKDWKPVTEFSVRRRLRCRPSYREACKPCRVLQSANQIRRHPEKLVEYTMRWREKNPLALPAADKVQYALRSGSLIKEPCTVCGNNKSEGHHDNYSKPLEVTWLCRKHHRDWHNSRSPLITYAPSTA